jgi:hypothetical protein
VAKVLHGPRDRHAKQALMLQAVAPKSPRVGTRIRAEALPASSCLGSAGRDENQCQATR